MPENLRPGFIQVPIAVYHSAELSDGAFKTYCMIKKHHNFEDPLGTFPSINRIAQLRNKTMRTIHKHVKELKRHGFITVMSGGKGKSNRYIFKDPECICTHCKKDSVWDEVEEMVYLIIEKKVLSLPLYKEIGFSLITFENDILFLQLKALLEDLFGFMTLDTLLLH